jgi:MYXO-CTERM domain-containing protein
MSRRIERLLVVLVGALVLLFGARPARACQYATCQSAGAVTLPSGADLSLPFKAGEHVYLLSGYGPTGGSSLHCRASDSSCANDWYALDLNLPDHSNHGKGQPVLAAADGTVLDAGWGSQGWANYGQRVYIHHDFGDGHVYTTMYAHLDTITVKTGDKVKKGDQIGTLGQSCQGALSCSSFSTPHTHFAVHRDANFGGTGSGGSYGGHAVIPEPLDGYTGLTQGQTLTSKNNGTTTPPQTGCNIIIQPTGTTLEEDGPCGEAVNGPLSDMNGHGGHAFWSTADTPDPNYVQGLFWHLVFAQAGTYQLSAYVPALTNATTGATYKIQYAGAATTKVLIDQSLTQGGWVDLGSFDFDAGGNQWVRLGDNYVNASDNGKSFAIDALRATPVSGSDAGTATDAGVPGDAGADATAPFDAAGLPDSSSDAAPGRGGTTAGSSGGCGCRLGGRAPSAPPALFALLGLGLFVLRRRG